MVKKPCHKLDPQSMHKCERGNTLIVERCIVYFTIGIHTVKKTPKNNHNKKIIIWEKNNT